MKDYQINHNTGVGIPVDATFAQHKASCAKCAGFDGGPIGLAALCLEGSVLWKRENVVQQEKAPVIRDERKVSKAELKRIMRYKE